VPGNHEYLPRRPELGAWREFLAAQNVRVLWNEGVRIARGGSSLWLAGIDDPGAGEPDLAAALAGRAPDEPTVLLAHHPDVFCHSRTLQVDLQLSGHTHGGQILLFGWAPITHSRFGWWRGHHAEDGAQLYVGRGVGVTLLPLRLGVRNEVPLLVLRTGAQR
jgi:predicted MPP superfamily phosphohydrolase